MGGGCLVLGCSSRCFQIHVGGAEYGRVFRLRNGGGGGGGWQPKQEAVRLRRGIRIWNPPLSHPQITSQVETEAEDFSIIDKNGRFCSPRAARELALLILYASCLEGTDPVRLFEKRLNAPQELYYEFDKSSLLSYNHMSFGEPPITATTMDEANQLLNQLELQSATEAEVLSAPPKLVYSKLLLRFTKKLLSVVVDRWDRHVLIIDQVIPPNWKIDPAGRILEFSILHLAMSEISGVGTRHQIVINEAVDLAKRFCDGAAPRIINGCLRSYVQNIS